MKTIIRDNPVVHQPRVFTGMTCSKCGELYEADRIHICRQRNSYPDISEGTALKRPKAMAIPSDALLDEIESYCDADDRISFEVIYAVVNKLAKSSNQK